MARKKAAKRKAAARKVTRKRRGRRPGVAGMSIAQLEAAITPRTAAIMPVHLTGEVTEMGRVMEIAARHRLPVVEDSCQAILGEWQGKRAGTFGAAAGLGSGHAIGV